MKYRAVLFDFDGTLAPSLPLWLKAYHFALSRCGVTATDEEVFRRCFFRDWVDVAADYGVFTALEFQQQVDVGLRQSFAEAELFPLVPELIEHCRAYGLQTALVTSSPRNIVIGVITRLGLGQLFDFVICGDDVKNYKPHPEPVLTALQALQRLPVEAIMIGDSHVDILAGKAAGTRTALFLPEGHNPFHNVEKLHSAGPDHVFSDHSELPALLELPELLAGARQLA
jgi:pyrophosphatase PpaX